MFVSLLKIPLIMVSTIKQLTINKYLRDQMRNFFSAKHQNQSALDTY